MGWFSTVVAVSFLFGWLLPIAEIQYSLYTLPRYRQLYRYADPVHSAITFSLCVLSIVSASNATDDYLLEMTPLHEWVLILVCASFAFDLGFMIERRYTRSWHTICHHVLSLGGCYVMIKYSVGGGMTVRSSGSRPCLSACLLRLVCRCACCWTS